MAKHIFVLGGVISSLGKGIASASIGFLFKEMGYSVKIQKLDPYLNVDPGTMSPYQHGEVYVTRDGAETDLDLGHYERFLNQDILSDGNITAGKIYYSVIEKERNGEYLGQTIQVIPHITNDIKSFIEANENRCDIIITEIGGTVGDIESFQFVEAVRQMIIEKDHSDTISILLTYVPYIHSAGELKTKPTQHASIKLREIGIQPDILLCRSEKKFNLEIKEKIALFTNVKETNVLNAIDVNSIYEVPKSFYSQNLQKIICDHFDINEKKIDFTVWDSFVEKIKNPPETVKIAICGKYVGHQDAYKSIVEAFVHAGVANKVGVDIKWIASEDLKDENNVKTALKNCSGLLIPGGFDTRGISGKIKAVRYARENKIPFFGICLGMHIAVIEFAINVCGLSGANSTEFDENSPDPVICRMKDQIYLKKYGATMRLGSFLCNFLKGSRIKEIYNSSSALERHRHRYEFNNDYRKIFEDFGLVLSGLSPDKLLVETIELTKYPFFIGVQYHPEFLSRPTNPHPLFSRFIYESQKKQNLINIRSKNV